MNINRKEEENFKIRNYGKSELASLYIPDIAPYSAADVLRKWIAKAPGLAEALAASGLKPKDKRYTPAQVQMIVSVIGEP